ncbi:hypothetical protein RUND412_005607 [Rhizina undulata]
MSANKIATPVAPRIGILDFEDSSLPTVRYTKPETSSPKPLEGIQQYHYLPDSTKQLGKDHAYWFALKEAISARKTFAKVLKFLGSGKSKQRRPQSSMQLGQSALVKQVGPVDNVSNHCFLEASISADTSSEGGDHNMTSQRPPAFINVKVQNLKANDTIEEIDSVHILTGTCMFSQEQLPPLDIDEDVSKIPEDALPEHRTRDEIATLYEIECITYLSESTADVISTLPPNVPITITPDVPRIQYYASALDLYRLGRCTMSSLLAWMVRMDRRHDQLAQVFTKSIESAIRRRGLESRNIEIKISSDFDAATPAIKASVLQGVKPTSAHFSEILSEVNPGVWSEFKEIADATEQNTSTLHYFCNLSYTYEFLRPILERSRRAKAGESLAGRQLVINVDSHYNQRIFTCGQKMFNLLRRQQSVGTDAAIIGIWPLEHVFTSETTGKSNIYTNNPGPKIFDPVDFRIITPGDVVSEIYGAHATQPVLQFMEEVGLSCRHSSSSSSSSSTSASSFMERSGSTLSASVHSEETFVSSNFAEPEIMKTD